MGGVQNAGRQRADRCSETNGESKNDRQQVGAMTAAEIRHLLLRLDSDYALILIICELSDQESIWNRSVSSALFQSVSTVSLGPKHFGTDQKRLV